MRVKTSAAYLRRYAARGQRMAAKTRPSDRAAVAVTSKPNHRDRVVTVQCFPQPMGEEMWLV